MVVIIFLAILTLTLLFGGWLLTRTSARIDGVAADERGEQICDPAEDGWAL